MSERLAGGFSRPLSGFAACGDAFLIAPAGDDSLVVAVIDGLGHGPEANEAAVAAVDAIRAGLDLPLTDMLRRCDAALRGTRGAAVGVLRLGASGAGEFCGIGNVEVQALAGKQPGLFCLAGIVGHNLRTVRAMPFAMQRGDIYCLHSDGVSGRGDQRTCLPGEPAAVARCIVETHGRNHDDATAVIVGFAAGAQLRPAGTGREAPAGRPG